MHTILHVLRAIRTRVYATLAQYVIKLTVGVASGPGILPPKVYTHFKMYLMCIQASAQVCL